MKKLGFGLMRPPMNGNEVDLPQLKQMVDLFMERGFTYFDTAFGYLDGKSEEAAKAALFDRYPRESFLFATKLPAWEASSEEEAKAMFDISLKRTGAGYFDYYLYHNVGANRTAFFDKFGIWDFLKEKKELGLIRKLGFSFHDRAEVLDRLLTEHPEMDFVQLQINYADWENARIQSRLCYETARAHGKEIIVMEPVKGGSLSNLPEAVAKPMRDYAPESSLSSWAIRFAASCEGVLTVLSGMSTLEQVEDNTSYMQNFVPLNEKEYEVIHQVQDLLSKTPHTPCTDCRYCIKDCPQSVKIPQIFSALNIYQIYNNLHNAKRVYNFNTKDGGGAGACIGCGQCESVCPQSIAIIETLRTAKELLE